MPKFLMCCLVTLKNKVVAWNIYFEQKIFDEKTKSATFS